MKTTRRSFLKTVAMSGAALVVGFDGARLLRGETTTSGPVRLSKWIRIDASGTVTLTVHEAEMGQGVRTSLAMLLADELDADWSRIAIIGAVPGPPDFPNLGSTGGSDSVESAWGGFRRAGAAAREMLVQAAATRWNVAPSECSTENGAVLHRASGRRLAYGDLVAEAARLPLPEKPTIKSPDRFRFIGRATRRIDGRAAVTGAAQYGCDTRVPGMLRASIERSPWPGAKPAKWNEAAARAVQGVRAVVPMRNGIAVVADGHWSALKGRAMLAVEWTGGDATFDSAIHRQRLEAASREPGESLRKEDAPAGTGAVTKTIDAVYAYPFYAHAPLETMNCVADVRGDACTLWVPTQTSMRCRNGVAAALSIPPENVVVNVTIMGGGFGRRLTADYAIEAAEISRAVQAPVQVLWSRADDMQHGHFQAASVHRLAGGFDAAGKLVDWRHTKAGSFHNVGAPPTEKERAEPHFFRYAAWGVYDAPYAVPAIDARYVPVEVGVKHGPWRSVFAPASVFARECFLDELAQAAGADPLAYRLEMLRGEDLITAGPTKIDRRRLRAVLELVREKSGWDKPLAGTRRGRGVACNAYFGGTCIAYVAEVSVAKTGAVRVDRVVAAVDCGFVVNPTGVQQQVEGGIIWGLSSALKGSITFQDGQAQQRSFAEFDVARMQDSPLVEVHLVASSVATPLGIGEPPVPPSVPAIVNAIFAATGRRIRELPVRDEMLRA